MSEDYTRRDYAEDMPRSVQATSVSGAVNERHAGVEIHTSDLDWPEEPNPGHDSDEEAIEGYCGGSRDSREPEDTADKLAEKFAGYQ